jgi:hypothetical protein
MSQPNFRALLEEVGDAAERHVSPYPGHANDWDEILDRISAALATPEQGPKDEELGAIFYDTINGCEFMDVVQFEAAARAVLARYDLPTPIPKGKRPLWRGSNFHDDQERCWCGTKAFVDEHGDRPVDYPPSWELREPCAQDDYFLPHWAIPLPEVEG